MELIVLWHGWPDAGSKIRLNEEAPGRPLPFPIVLRDGGMRLRPGVLGAGDWG